MSLIDYSRVSWANSESGGTPLNATNLNNMDYGIYQLDNALAKLSAASNGALTLSAGLTLTSYLHLTGSGIAIANGYGVYHYNTAGEYARFEFLDTSDTFCVGNNSYPTYLRGSSVTVKDNLTVEDAVYCGQGVALGNNYGVHHYNTDGEYAKFEFLNTSDTFCVGNSSYATALRGSSITASTSITTSSDARLKTDYGDLGDAHDALFDGLRPLTFCYIGGDVRHMGLTVQDTEAAMEAAGLDPAAYALTDWQPDAESGESYGALAYDELIALLVEQVQALKARVTALEEGG